MEYNNIINTINAQDEDGDGLWDFHSVKDQRGAGRDIEVLIDWDGTNTSWEPLSQMKNADMVKLSKYEKEKRLTGKFS